MSFSRWSWIRISVAVSMVLLLYGIVYTFLGFWTMLFIKTPAPWVCTTGMAGNTGQLNTGSREWCFHGASILFDPTNPWNYFGNLMLIIMIPCLVLFGLMIPSFGLFAKTSLYVDMQKRRIAEATCSPREDTSVDVEGIGVTMQDAALPSSSSSPAVGTGAGGTGSSGDAMLTHLTTIEYARVIAESGLSYASLKAAAVKHPQYVDNILERAGVAHPGHRLDITVWLGQC